MNSHLIKLSSLLFFISCFFFISSHQSEIKYRKISGYIFNEGLEPIYGANVFIPETRKGTVTDKKGFFEIRIPEITKKLDVNAYGFKSMELKITNEDQYKVTLVKSTEVEVNPVSEVKTGKERSKLFRPVSKDYDALEMESIEPARYDSKIGFEDMDAGRMESYIEESKMKESAGQLTAGEWNDLRNWEAWKKLIKETDYVEMEKYWEINSHNRYSVFVTNKYELPIPDCTVELRSGNKVIWAAKSDQEGKAEMWAMEGMKNLKLVVRSDHNTWSSEDVRSIERGVNRVQFDEVCSAPKKADIMFVVDATGSMGDEIEFLKAELSDVIQNVESKRSGVEFRWGSVFYRDGSDEYLTRQLPLSEDKDRILEFINQQSAGGGGDYPEAVEEGLEEALIQEWSEKAIARIIFLVLDAPPHHNPQVLENLHSQIEMAAAMGIKIIPITASGINRQTEYLMKFMSVMTNGTYVFLTDDSGIGNKHLKHISDDYEVEFLNDLIIRLIQNYADPGACAQQENEDVSFQKIEIYPNPNLGEFKLKIPSGVEKVMLTTGTGQLIKKIDQPKEEILDFDLISYIDGVYLLSVYHNKRVHNYKVIKINRA